MSIFKRIFHNVKAQVGSLYDNDNKVHYELFDKFEDEENFRRDFRKEKKVHPKAVNKELLDCYATLEIPYGSDLATVRSAWKNLLKKYHPDRHHNDPKRHDAATEIAAEITASYKYIENYLKNFEKK